MDVIRRPKSDGIEFSEEEWSNDTLSIILRSSREIEPLIQEYPYGGQEEITGEISYTEVHPISSHDAQEVTFQFKYRTESGLFLLYRDGPSDESEVYEVLRRLNNNLSDNRFSSTQFSREALWSFVLIARDTPHLVVKDLYGENHDFSETDPPIEELVKNYFLERATLRFEFNDRLVRVEYNDGSISFSNPDVSEEERDYVLQLVELYLISDEISERVRRLIEE